jgi:hypothetical protein
MSRKLSQISPQEMQALHQACSDMFVSFCAFGAGQTGSTDMDGRKFAKFAKDCALLDRKKLTTTDIDLIFTRVKLKGKRTINFNGFQEAVRQIAIKKGMTYQELIIVASSAGGPGTTNVTKVAGGDQTRFFDDQSQYTGVAARGGPDVGSNNVNDISSLLDRSDYDVRGRKIEQPHSQPHRQVTSSAAAAASRPHGGGGASTGGIRHAQQMASNSVGAGMSRGASQRSAGGGSGGGGCCGASAPAPPSPHRPAPAPAPARGGGGGGGGDQQVSMDELYAAVGDSFDRFVSFGGRGTSEMTGTVFVKMMNDGHVMDSRFTRTDADLIFSQIVKKGQKLPKRAFLEVVLPKVAERKGLRGGQGLYQLMYQLAGSGISSSGTKAQSTRFHDDKSQYTGVHARGGPTNVDDSITLANLADRSDYDVRGVKLNQHTGGR